jgi:superfamily I DNA/RNA helicase
MGQSANLYGPPGAGKTRTLVSIAEAVVREYGPQALGAVTFTRAAASELKERLAPIARLNPNAANRDMLNRAFPYVGTIHSLCYRLTGRPTIVTNAHKTEWARSAGDERAHFDGTDSIDRLDTFDLGDRPTSKAEWALDLYSAARQRCIPVEDMLRIRSGAEMSIATLGALVDSYEDYKHDMDVLDFDDLLEMGIAERLPVKYLLVDEAQDNSRLLWRVIDAWRENIERTVCAGDPWQALFIFSGGDPALFRGQPGGWTTIGNSHRLTPEAATYAQTILRAGGFGEDPLITDWTGVRNVQSQDLDGTHFWLARTGKLVYRIGTMLEAAGEPYAFLNGRGGPLGARGTEAWRAAHELLLDETTTASGLSAFVKALPRGLMDPREIKRVSGLRGRVSLDDIPDWSQHLKRFQRALPRADYFERVRARYGDAALVLPPVNRIGTIHSAKGREADYVTLVRGWGSLPAQAMLRGDTGETCVAYVGASRHRVALDFLDLAEGGIDYPFPRA